MTGTDGNLARLTLGYSPEPQSRDALEMVQALRAQPAPLDGAASFIGMLASRADIVDMIDRYAPWMILFAAVVSFLVLFLAFGSVVLPLKAIALNLLSLSAALGAIWLAFGEGYLSGLLGFDPIGALDVNFPVFVLAIAFGLALDYEVFLLSRIREHWMRTGDATESIAVGLQRTGTIITSAALLLIVVVAGFLTSQVALMQVIGVGSPSRSSSTSRSSGCCWCRRRCGYTGPARGGRLAMGALVHDPDGDHTQAGHQGDLFDDVVRFCEESLPENSIYGCRRASSRPR
ncbi:MAG: MMPL family transporter [Pseudonocardiaceae bacterium]